MINEHLHKLINNIGLKIILLHWGQITKYLSQKSRALIIHI